MTKIESLVRKLLPDLCKDKALSLICLSTSNPVYLVFIEHSHSPDLVVRLSPSDGICIAHHITERLHKILGDLIPKPLILTKTDKTNISIQEGANGSPWFQLATKYASPDQREKIHICAIKSLNKLHAGISSSSDWIKTIQPGNELRQSYQQCLTSGTVLPDETEALVKQLSTHMDSLGELSSFAQHGDFCLNNLIFDGSEAHIIDFEDFAATHMPFHDQFTLALSFYQLSPSSAHMTINSAIKSCINNKIHTQAAPTSSLLPGAFMNHLLLRLGPWSKDREEYRQWLLSILEKFNESPDSFFKNIDLT